MTPQTPTSGEQRLTRRLRNRLADAGLTGSFLVRDLQTSQEIGIDPDIELPIASLVKVPLAVAVLNRIHVGDIDGARMVEISPRPRETIGGVGLSRFRHPAHISIDDLLYLSLAISDNAASDALFELVPPAEVQRTLREMNVSGIAVRHSMSGLEQSPAAVLAPDQVHLAQLLAIGAGTAGGGHPVAQLDVTKANTGNARAFTDLLEALWVCRPGTSTAIPADVTTRIRELMRGNLIAQRLAPDFTSDAATWSSKTGTLLNLRHEAGVVEHDDGAVLAVVAFTESGVAAASQPAAEALMGEVARALHDYLRNAE